MMVPTAINAVGVRARFVFSNRTVDRVALKASWVASTIFGCMSKYKAFFALDRLMEIRHFQV
jgi:hypothetical protein